MAVQKQENKSKSDSFPPGLRRWFEIFISETVATGMLMFFGCLSLIVWQKDTPLHPWQGPIVFAAVVSTVIQIFGHISGAHINPSVTICFLLLNRITPMDSLVYIVGEFFGAIFGFGLIKLITPCDILNLNENLCSNLPHPSVTDLQAIAAEFMATACLIILVCALIDPRTAHQTSANSLKFGVTVIAIAISLGPYTGASMNPARTFAPALWNGTWQKHWIYWLAPTASSIITTIFYKTMFIPKPSSLTEQTEEDLPLNSINVKTDKNEVKEENTQ